MKHVLVSALFVMLAFAPSASAEDFTHLPPGDLIPGSGTGRVDEKLYAPELLFPIEGKAYANSQVYMTGGLYGPSGDQCSVVNFSYPWRDNYCEERSWDMPLCPAGTGHQGQDIRAASCEKSLHVARAAIDGTITSIGSYSVYLTAADGTRYDYLHMDNVQVSVGQKVKSGAELGRVSNNFGGTSTSVHLHFNIKQNIASLGSVYVPPYLSLVKAYEATLSQPPRGVVELADCDRVAGWAFAPEQPDAQVAVDVEADAKPSAAVAEVLAERDRSDLCQTLGSCNHAFSAASPLSLFDGTSHVVRLRAIDPTDAKRYELLESPSTLTCEPFQPKGARRRLDQSAVAAWKLSSFWDELPQDASSLPVGHTFPSSREAFADPIDASRLWIVDEGQRRGLAVGDSDGWHINPAALKKATDAVLQLSEGQPFPRRAVWVTVKGSPFILDEGDTPEETVSPVDPEPQGPDGTLSGASESASCALGSTANPAPLWLLGLSAVIGLARRRKSRPQSL